MKKEDSAYNLVRFGAMVIQFMIVMSVVMVGVIHDLGKPMWVVFAYAFSFGGFIWLCRSKLRAFECLVASETKTKFATSRAMLDALIASTKKQTEDDLPTRFIDTTITDEVLFI